MVTVRKCPMSINNLMMIIRISYLSEENVHCFSKTVRIIRSKKTCYEKTAGGAGLCCFACWEVVLMAITAQRHPVILQNNHILLPLPFSFSSSSASPFQPQKKQDILLCRSLLECTFHRSAVSLYPSKRKQESTI